jgi:hypothetical protein
MATRRRAGYRCRAALAGLLFATTGASLALAAASLPAEVSEIASSRGEIARDLGGTIAKCVVRHDTAYPVFHGCIDWHSGVHGYYALTAVARATDDRKLLDWITTQLDPELLARERRAVAADSDFEMPYGRAWFLRLALEYQRAGGDDRLTGMADDIAASLVAYLGSRRFDPLVGSYESETWAMLALRAYGVARKKADVVAFVDGEVAAAVKSGARGCPFNEDAREESFMAICTNWAWLIGESIAGPAGVDAIHAILPPDARMAPVADPTAPHVYGLDFSRAWGLWNVWQRTGDERYLAAYADHFRRGYEDRTWWAGDYHVVGHWVAQFGVFALMPLFEEAVGNRR